MVFYTFSGWLRYVKKFSGKDRDALVNTPKKLDELHKEYEKYAKDNYRP